MSQFAERTPCLRWEKIWMRTAEGFNMKKDGRCLSLGIPVASTLSLYLVEGLYWDVFSQHVSNKNPCSFHCLKTKDAKSFFCLKCQGWSRISRKDSWSAKKTSWTWLQALNLSGVLTNVHVVRSFASTDWMCCGWLHSSALENSKTLSWGTESQ